MYLLAFAESIQLFPDGTIFIHIGLILLMIWILNRTLFKPINRIMESREKSKGGRSTEAVGILKSVEAKETTYSAELLAARSRGYEVIENEQRAAIEAREAKIAASKAEIAASLAADRDAVNAATEASRAEIAIEADKLSDSIAAGILKA
jgi:F-type H+-transporting ATPase subunit b